MSFCCFEVLALPSKTLTNPGPQIFVFFFVALLPGGFNLRSLQKIQDMIERRSNTGVPMSHLMSCELCRCADVLFRVFHLFFKKLPLSVFCFWTIGRRNWISSPWATLVSIASTWGKVNSCYPSRLPTSSTSPVFEVKRFITTGRQGILVVEGRLLLLVATKLLLVAARKWWKNSSWPSFLVLPPRSVSWCVLIFFVFGNQLFFYGEKTRK